MLKPDVKEANSIKNDANVEVKDAKLVSTIDDRIDESEDEEDNEDDNDALN